MPTPDIEFSNKVEKKTVNFPPSVSKPLQDSILSCQSSIVVVGANGAGKSRLGSWLELEGPQKSQIFRIAAQRSLVFPEDSSPVNPQAAAEVFHWGTTKPPSWSDEAFETNKISLRSNNKYGGAQNATTAQVNDYKALLTLLFSDSYATLSKYEAEQKLTNSRNKIPDTLLSKVQKLWEALLPNKKLIQNGSEIRVQSTTNLKDYSATSMSDGERVLFYLIGKCICAPQNSIIVVDEPEIHLHKSIQDSLWNSIERARIDCTFIYLTHDLTFAADRTGAIKICLTDYSSDGFSWFSIEAQQGIPDDIYLEMLGSRKPVIFVEGAPGSPDFELYSLAFPRFTIKPAGNCSSVVSATKTFNSLKDMHHIKCFGIVDRDYLENGQIAAYERHEIFTPSVAEVENLYLVPELLFELAEQLMLPNPNEITAKVKMHVISKFKKSRLSHARETMRHQVALALGRFSSSAEEIDQYRTDLKNHLDSIEARNFHDQALSEADALIAAEDYKGILRVFNQKGLADQIAHFFEIRQGTYLEKIREMSKQGKGNIPRHLRAYLPNLDARL